MLIYPGPERRARRRFQRRLTPFSSVLPFHICNEVMIPVCDITLQTAEQPACRDCSHWLSLLGGGGLRRGSKCGLSAGGAGRPPTRQPVLRESWWAELLLELRVLASEWEGKDPCLLRCPGHYCSHLAESTAQAGPDAPNASAAAPIDRRGAFVEETLGPRRP